MKDKILLELESISKSITHDNSYTLILHQAGGSTKLAIVIGGAEAQSIAMVINKMKPPRPLTHDLLKNIIDLFGANVKEVLISEVKEGVFFAQILCDLNGKEHVIDARTSDAIALAVRYHAPIYTIPRVLEEAGIDSPDSDDTTASPVSTTKEPVHSLSNMTIADLEKELNKAVDAELYDKAAEIRDEIQKRKGDA